MGLRFLGQELPWSQKMMEGKISNREIVGILKMNIIKSFNFVGTKFRGLTTMDMFVDT